MIIFAKHLLTYLHSAYRCLQTSAGPAFIALLGNKYGYRPFPAQIEQPEFEKLLSTLDADGADTTTLRDHFRLDLNGVSDYSYLGLYVLIFSTFLVMVRIVQGANRPGYEKSRTVRI